MAVGAWTTYDAFQKAMADSTHDLDANTYNVALFLSTSNANTGTHDTLSDLTNEHSNANGYTTGGVTLTGVAWTVASGIAKFTSDAASWTASGGPIVARFAVLYRSGTVNGVTDALVARCLLDSTPADVTVADGSPLTLTPHANGYFRVGRGTIS